MQKVLRDPEVATAVAALRASHVALHIHIDDPFGVFVARAVVDMSDDEVRVLKATLDLAFCADEVDEPRGA